MKIAIVTDSSSGMLEEDIANNDIFIIPLPIIINGEEYFENINLTSKEFYERLSEKNTNITTSQPSLQSVEDMWNRLLESYDHILHMPVSSTLSSAYSAAENLAKNNFDGKVTVIDSLNLSVPLKVRILKARKMLNEGQSIEDVKNYIDTDGVKYDIFIAMNSIKYLKKGGRLGASKAFIGSILNIKPVIRFALGKGDSYKNVITNKLATSTIFSAIEKKLKTTYLEYLNAGKMRISLAYSDNKEILKDLISMVEKKFPNIPIEFIDPLPLIVATHVGTGAIGISCYVD